MVAGHVDALWDVEQWGLAEAADDVHACRTREMLHKQVILREEMSRAKMKQRSKMTPRFGISRQWICPEVIVLKGLCRSNTLARITCE